MSAQNLAANIFGRKVFDEGIQPGDVKSPYNMYTSDDVNTYEDIQATKEIIGSITKYGLSAGALFTVKELLKRQSAQNKLRDYITLSYLSESINGTADDAVRAYGGRVTLTNLAMNTARAFEELSPFSILKTFQTSHIMQPFATKTGEHFFTPELLKYQKKYFEELAHKYGNRGITSADISTGILYKDGKLFSSSGEEIISNARLVTSEWTGHTGGHDEGSMYNKILRRHILRHQDMSAQSRKEIFDLSKNILDTEAPFTVIADTKDTNINKGWIKSVIGQGVAQGFNMVNEPLGFVEELGGTLFNENNSVFRFINKYGKINPHANADMKIADLAVGYVRHGAVKLGILGAAYYTLDNMAKVIGTSGSGYDQGIIEGVSTTAVNAKIAYAEMVSDRFEEYTTQQEYVAPGSTSLLRLAGFPLVGAMLAGTVAYSKRVVPSVLSDEGYKAGQRMAHTQGDVISSGVSQLVSNTSIESSLGRIGNTKKWAMRGALAGLALALPFLPGALAGESSDSIKDRYLYGEDVEQRSNALWFSGSTDIEGGGIKYFTKNWYQRLMAGNKDKILYGDGDTKEELNPFLNPIDYLQNPYRLEEMHQDDMPYPIWGMDVSVGGWAGKIFERTIGQIIKPDRINPNMAQLMENPNSIDQDYYASDENSYAFAYNFGDITRKPSFEVPVNYSNVEQSLINDDMITKRKNLTYSPYAESAQYIYNSASDYIGLKGWAISGALSEFAVGDFSQKDQLARSGESTNVAREFVEQNLGGLFGAADILRRIVPMSSSVLYDRANPLHNSVAPSWLPSGEYYTNFSKGNYYGHVDLGYDRMPGLGYEYYNPEVKGLNLEDYPDIHKFKVLSDVAYGSSEFYNAKELMESKYNSGEMTESEIVIYETTWDQLQRRAQKKTFAEYKTDEDYDNVSVGGELLGKLWETITHNAELPTERLTFFRPAGKLLHQRTAIEDYEKTQLIASDTALWNEPFKHFIRPFMEESYKTFDKSYIPEHTQEKRNIDNYFDALEYYKQMKVYRENAKGNLFMANQAKAKAYKTTYGALASGLDSESDVSSAYMGLSSEEKQYFTSFVNAKDSDRERIASIVDGNNISEIYKMLWSRKDVIESGGDISEYLQDEEQQLIQSNRQVYNAYERSGDADIGISFREYLQEKRAEKLIVDATGMPDEEFAGWDPRLNVKDIKLRTLNIGGENAIEFGYYQDDQDDLKRQSAILAEDQVTTQLKSIRRTKAQQRFDTSNMIKDELYRNGIRAVNVNISNSGHGDFDMTVYNRQ
jgi:hypothetical protein